MKKSVTSEGSTVRILEMSPRWDEAEWCTKSHIGYVLSGRLRLDFAKQRSLHMGKGEGFSIPKGCAHRASCGGTTRIFMVG
jgi:quercetin dioxygenase-like cupin family protein